MPWTWSFRIGVGSGRGWLEADLGGSGKGSSAAKRQGKRILGTLSLGSGADRGVPPCSGAFEGAGRKRECQVYGRARILIVLEKKWRGWRVVAGGGYERSRRVSSGLLLLNDTTFTLGLQYGAPLAPYSFRPPSSLFSLPSLSWSCTNGGKH